MITNEKQLQVVREQLATAEAALDSLRREVLFQNPEMYEVMSESYIDMILSLRGEIDAYLGIEAIPETADLVISLEGQRVGLGHTSAALVTRFIDTFRRGLQSAVEIIESIDRPDAAHRRARWIENICDLPFVGVVPGSVKILLGEPEFQGLFSQEEMQSFSKAVDLVFEGLTWADTYNVDSPDHPFANLSKETRQSLLGLISRLLPPRSGDVERVAFRRKASPESVGKSTTATLTRSSRERIRAALEEMATDAEYAELEGVIRSVDLDTQTFVLRERPDNQPDLPCEYGSELEDAVKEFLDSRVLVAGSLQTSQKTKKARMSADTIELVSKDSGQSQQEVASD